MEFEAFLTSLGTSFVLFVVLMFLFTWLSKKPENYLVYYSNWILKGQNSTAENGNKTRNPFVWIREAFSSTEADIINVSGVDSAVYFIFLTTVLGILVFSSLLFLPVLLPVAGRADSLKVVNVSDIVSQVTFDNLDKLSIGHVGDGNNPRLWAILVATYWVSFLAYYLLWKAYKHVVNLRATALRSSDMKLEQFAILVRDIPRVCDGQTMKEQVDSYFREIYQDTFYRSLVVTDNNEVNKIYEELEGLKKKLARAEAVYTEGERPFHKLGFLGLVGKKVDSIEYYNERISELIPKLRAAQKITLREKQQSAALVFFTSRVVAASASQSLHAQMVDTWTVIDAPEPRQIIWTNLRKTLHERYIRQCVIYFIVFLTIFLYMIPIGFISAFAAPVNLKTLLPFTKPVVKTALQAYLPQVTLIILLALLSKFLLFLSKAEGIPSQAHIHRAASRKSSYVSVLTGFIGVTIIRSTLSDTCTQIENKPYSTCDLLACSLPKSVPFFLTYMALQFFVGYGLELSRLVPLILFRFKKKYLCKTEAEVKEACAPGDLGYATRFPTDMLILTIVLCYSIIAPIFIPFGVVYFGLGWFVLRNQVLKVYVPSYESYGRMWAHIFNHILASLSLYQVTMVGFIGVKKFHHAIILIPLPILTLVYCYVCNNKFYRGFRSTALEVASHELKETPPNMELVFKSFILPCLIDEKSDDDHFEDALSVFSRSVSSTVCIFV